MLTSKYDPFSRTVTYILSNGRRVTVPYTVAWSGEQSFFVGPCEHAMNRQAICQVIAPGDGRPTFGKPHSQRQRHAVASGLCDLCGRSLAKRTKVSLSHARARTNGAEGMAIMQVEPLLHRACAAECIKYCPSLKRDIRNGTLMVRQVTRYRVQFAVMSPEFVHTYVPGYIAAPHDKIIGHAKVELLAWVDRDESWLKAKEGRG